MPTKLIDETGNKYGSLTVISVTKDKNDCTAWLCKCDCGNTKIVRGSDLRKGKITHCSKSCPCKINGKFIDEIGNRYGFLTVLHRAEENSPSNKVMWHCKCDCGNEIDVIGESLRENLTKSCGCKSKELNAQSHTRDLKNQPFGYLIPIEIVRRSPEGNIWRCKCNCGCGRDDIEISSHRLLSNNTKSCGRIRRSHAEIEIENYLKNNNFNYKTEYSFEDLISEKNKKLRFDFAVFKTEKELSFLIEFDGAQHFAPVEYFGGEEGYLALKKNDELKNIYCKNKNIPLLRIKYDEDILNKIKIFMEENF